MAAALKFTYLQDETTLSKTHGVPIVDYVRLFNLDGVGVDQARFLAELGPSFADLPWDTYDLKLEQTHYLARCFPSEKKRIDQWHNDYHVGNVGLEAVADLIGRLTPERHRKFDELEPFRRRTVSKFELEAKPDGGWSIKRIPARSFAQHVGAADYRSHVRIFAESAERVTSHPEFLKLLSSLAYMAASINPQIRKQSITMHQVSIVTDADTLGDNSPEGIHQDGSDFIVSALVVARQGITGGQSVVYGSDKTTEYLRHELKPGEGIFQEDKNSTLWHDVTPIHLNREAHAEEGMRNIFGFDIDVAA